MPLFTGPLSGTDIALFAHILIELPAYLSFLLAPWSQIPTILFVPDPSTNTSPDQSDESTDLNSSADDLLTRGEALELARQHVAETQAIYKASITPLLRSYALALLSTILIAVIASPIYTYSGRKQPICLALSIYHIGPIFRAGWRLWVAAGVGDDMVSGKYVDGVWVPVWRGEGKRPVVESSEHWYMRRGEEEPLTFRNMVLQNPLVHLVGHIAVGFGLVCAGLLG